nr:HAD family phosphatase [Candidatus Sigynarchaeota archaeon]
MDSSSTVARGVLARIVQENDIHGIIFDLDGTLTHTLNEHVEAFIRVFSSHGFHVDRATIENNMGRRPPDITRDLIFNGKPDDELDEKSRTLLYQMASEKIQTFRSLIPVKPPILPGLPSLLDQAKTLGLKLAVCSSTPLQNVTIILERIGLLQYFDALVTAEDVRVGKPDPEAFLKAAEKLGLQKSHVLVIGDSIHDVKGAMQGGLKIIAVATGKHDVSTLEATHPLATIHTLADLL